MKSTFESCLIEQCAPTLAGLKPASLFPYSVGEGESVAEILSRWNGELSEKGICLKEMRRSSDRSLFLVYRPRAIERILQNKEVASFLEEYGYRGCTKPEHFIEEMSRRMSRAPAFPHEIGIFLGYPLHDVAGFIKNRGKNFCCSGNWKVYGEKEAAERLFKQIKSCTEIYKSLYKSGKTVSQLTADVCLSPHESGYYINILGEATSARR